MKKVLITGATSGIGLETVKELHQDYEFIVGCRNLEKAQDVFKDLDNVKYIKLDLANLESVEKFCQNVLDNFQSIDILINNGGVFHPEYTTTYYDQELQFATNYLSHFLITCRLINIIKEKVITVSSIAHRADSARIHYEDINFSQKYSKWESYQQSKLACILFGIELDKRLKDSKSKVVSIVTHPGVSSTAITREYPFIVNIGMHLLILTGIVQSTKNGALATNYAIVNDELIGGEYIGPYKRNQRSGPVKVLKASENVYIQSEREKLWDFSECLLNVNFSLS